MNRLELALLATQAAEKVALTDAEFVAGNVCDDILNALPVDAWGHIISCGYDDNDERCECSTLRPRLEAIVAARVVEAVDRERAAWAAKGSKQDRRDVAAWLIREADQRVKFFPQRRDGVDELMRSLAMAAVVSK